MSTVDPAVPRQRTKGLVVRAHGEETLVLDRRTGTVHCLPAEVTRVWGACTGHATLNEIATFAGVQEQIAASAVDQLTALDLLEAPVGIDRRKFLRRASLAGGGALAIPVIESVVAPPAALAQSKPGTLNFTVSCGVGGVAGQMGWTASFPANSGWDPNTTYSITVAVTGGGSSSMAGLTTDGSGAGTTDPNGTAIGNPGDFPDPGTPVTVTVVNTRTQETFTLDEQLTTTTGEGCPAQGGQFFGVGPPTMKSASGDSSLINYPAGTAAGDLVIVIVIDAATQTVTPPAGWTALAPLVVGSGNPQREMGAWWKVSGGETSVTWSAIQTNSSGAAAWAVVYRNLTAQSGTAAYGSTATQDATMTPGAFSTTAPNATVISIVGLRGPGSNQPINAPTLSAAQGFTQNVSTAVGPGTAPTAGTVYLGLGTASQFVATPNPVTSPTWSQQGTAAYSGYWLWITAAFT